MNVGNAATDVKNICNSGDDSRKRQDMFIDGIWKLGSAIPAVNNLSFIGNKSQSVFSTYAAMSSDPFYDTNDLKTFISMINKLRLSCDTLNTGQLNIKYYNFGNSMF